MFKIDICRTNRKFNTLFYKGLSTFNILPWPIKECTNVNSFRKELIRSLVGGGIGFGGCGCRILLSFWSSPVVMVADFLSDSESVLLYDIFIFGMFIIIYFFVLHCSI
jgi:hypothetical protein